MVYDYTKNEMTEKRLKTDGKALQKKREQKKEANKIVND
jgi:hypothetical protein